MQIPAASILESLSSLSREHRRGLTLVDARKRTHIPYAELVERIRRFATGLRERGLVPGDSIVLVPVDPAEAIVAILGAMAAGCPPAPIYPPSGLSVMPTFLRHLAHVTERAGARRIIAAARLVPFLGAAPQPVDKMSALLDSAPGAFECPGRSDTAFFQFTSGTTSKPRGVIVTHGGLSSNLWMIRNASRMDDQSKVVTWLPVYHDMGLIGTVLNAISLGIDLSVLSPQTFLRHPRLWLEEISRVGGTHTAAPNFAYGLCVKRVPDTGGLDLSSMRVFICGAEPIQRATLERFNTHFAAAGLHPGAVTPAYGLAEATLAVTFTPYLRGVHCDASVTSRAVSCGVPLAGLQVRIADETDVALPDRTVGEVHVKGPSVSPGYIRDAEATRASRSSDGWLRTGDLGYLAGGELYLLGRRKDLIIVRGRNFYAHDIEGVVSEHGDIRTGNVVAFGVPSGDTEAVVVVAESRAPERAEGVSREVRARLLSALGVMAADVKIVAPGTLPKTSSGKLKRTETRDRYLAGRLTQNATKSTLDTWAVILQSGLGHLGVRPRPRV